MVFSRKRVRGPKDFLLNLNAAITFSLYSEYEPISIVE